MSKKTTEEEAIEVKQDTSIGEVSENARPAYVEELQEKGVVVLSASSRSELGEQLAAIPGTIAYYAGPIGQNSDSGMFTIQLNIKK